MSQNTKKQQATMQEQLKALVPMLRTIDQQRKENK